MKSKEEINKIIKGVRKDILYRNNLLKRKAKKSGDFVSYAISLNAFCLIKIKATEAKISKISLNKKYESGLIASNVISGVINKEEYVIPPHFSAISQIESLKKAH